MQKHCSYSICTHAHILQVLVHTLAYNNDDTYRPLYRVPCYRKSCMWQVLRMLGSNLQHTVFARAACVEKVANQAARQCTAWQGSLCKSLTHTAKSKSSFFFTCGVCSVFSRVSWIVSSLRALVKRSFWQASRSPLTWGRAVWHNPSLATTWNKQILSDMSEHYSISWWSWHSRRHQLCHICNKNTLDRPRCGFAFCPNCELHDCKHLYTYPNLWFIGVWPPKSCFGDCLEIGRVKVWRGLFGAHGSSRGSWRDPAKMGKEHLTKSFNKGIQHFK